MKSHKNSLVKVLEYLVNEEREKASELLHTIFVEKAKNHWSRMPLAFQHRSAWIAWSIQLPIASTCYDLRPMAPR